MTRSHCETFLMRKQGEEKPPAPQQSGAREQTEHVHGRPRRAPTLTLRRPRDFWSPNPLVTFLLEAPLLASPPHTFSSAVSFHISPFSTQSHFHP